MTAENTTIDDTAIDLVEEESAETIPVGPTTDTAPANPPKRTAPRRGRTTGRAARASVRRIAEKAEEIGSADEETRQLVADLIGAASAGIADLTTSIMEAKKTPVESAIADLAVIQAGSLPEATIHLVGMSKSELQALHRLVAVFADVDLPEKVPAKSTDAALVLVDAVREAQIDQDAIDRLLGLLAK